MPISKDANDGIDLAIKLAQIYVWSGEKDIAIEQIEMIQRVPNPLSYGYSNSIPTGIRSAAIRASNKSSLAPAEIVPSAAAASPGGWRCIAPQHAERCHSRHFLCNAAQSFGKEWEKASH